MSTYTEALSRASHVLRQIGAMPDPRADDLARTDEEPAATPAPPVAPLRPSDELIAEKAAQVDADLRKPVPPPIPAPREIAARLAPLVEPWTTASQVVCMVADAMGMEPPDVLNRRRGGRKSIALALTSWLIRERQRRSFPEIGRALGDRTHSTAMSAYRRAVVMVA